MVLKPRAMSSYEVTYKTLNWIAMATNVNFTLQLFLKYCHLQNAVLSILWKALLTLNASAKSS